MRRTSKLRRVWPSTVSQVWHSKTADGFTIVEALAAVVIGSMVVLGAVSLDSSVMHVYQSVGASSIQLSDTSLIYWQMQRLTQNAQSVGTQAVDNTGNYYYASGATGGPVPIVAMHVSSVTNIVPVTSAVYSAVNSGGDYVCIAVVPYNGQYVIGLFPGGDPYNPEAQPPVYPPTTDVTPILSEGTDYLGTQFNVLDNRSFTMSLQRTVARSGAFAVPNHAQASLSTLTLSFMIGRYDY